MTEFEDITRALQRVLQELAAIRGDVAEIRDRVQSIEAQLLHIRKKLEQP